jgi:hypothetical protein
MVVANDGEHNTSPLLEFPVWNSVSAQAICPPLFRVNPNRRFKFDKRRQLFIGTHNESLAIAVMCVRNPDCSPVGINRRDVTQAPTGFVMKIEFSD